MRTFTIFLFTLALAALAFLPSAFAQSDSAAPPSSGILAANTYSPFKAANAPSGSDSAQSTGGSWGQASSAQQSWTRPMGFDSASRRRALLDAIDEVIARRELRERFATNGIPTWNSYYSSSRVRRLDPLRDY